MSDGTAVGDTSSRWQNRLDTAKYFSQATAGNRPVFKTGGPNGKNYVQFTSDSLAYTNNLSTLVASNGVTMFFVVRPQTVGSNREVFFSSGAVTLFLMNSTGKFRHDIFSSVGGTHSASSTTSWASNTWYIVQIWYDTGASEVRIRVNTDTIVGAAASGLNPAGSTLTNALGLGNNAASFSFDLAHFSSFNADIGSTAREDHRSCLQSWFAL